MESDNNIELPSSVLLSSVPKSGTHLLKDIFASIFGNHFVVHPAHIFTMEPFRTEFVKHDSELPKRVYCDHIQYSSDLAKKVSQVPKIILIRDPRDNVVSLAHFLHKSNVVNYCTKKELEEYWDKRTWKEKLSAIIFGTEIGSYYLEPIMDYFLKFAIRWATEPNTLFVKYEDLIGSQFGGSDAKVVSTVRSIMQFIGLKNIDEEVLTKKIAAGTNLSLEKDSIHVLH